MTGAAADKQELRRRMRATLRAVPADELSRASQAICARLETWDLFGRAGAILLFLPLPGEPDLGPLAARSIGAGRRICVPRVDWETGGLACARIRDVHTDAPPGRRGVPTPHADLDAVALAEIDCILVPGLSFDRFGGRLGRAGGFYDRLLADPARRAPAIGVALEAQVVEAVPLEAHDQPVDGLVTESNLLLFEGFGRRRPI
ncbi:MAG: 5-formyltetrahydrofolate cyclo-ligase [Phycisphaerales bacterium JB039]